MELDPMETVEQANGAASRLNMLLAVTSLTQQRWLDLLALVPASAGVLMGLAGLCGWGIHPGTLVSWLT